MYVHVCVFQMYVTLVFRTKGTRLTKPTLCLTLLSLAVLVGVVRVTEHRNHWADVLAGYLTGGAIAAFLVRGDGAIVVLGNCSSVVLYLLRACGMI